MDNEGNRESGRDLPGESSRRLRINRSESPPPRVPESLKQNAIDVSRERRKPGRLLVFLVVFFLLFVAGAAALYFVDIQTEEGPVDWSETVKALEQIRSNPGHSQALQVLINTVKDSEDAFITHQTRAGIVTVVGLSHIVLGKADSGWATMKLVREKYGDTHFAGYASLEKLGTTCPVCGGKGLATCPECDGSGKCVNCEGSGRWPKPSARMKKPSLQSNGNVKRIGTSINKEAGEDGDTRICPACNGSGKCPKCGGRGKVRGNCPECGGRGSVFKKELASEKLDEAIGRTIKLASVLSGKSGLMRRIRDMQIRLRKSIDGSGGSTSTNSAAGLATDQY